MPLWRQRIGGDGERVRREAAVRAEIGHREIVRRWRILAGGFGHRRQIDGVPEMLGGVRLAGGPRGFVRRDFRAPERDVAFRERRELAPVWRLKPSAKRCVEEERLAVRAHWR